MSENVKLRTVSAIIRRVAMKGRETNYYGVFDSPLSDYERVFRPLLPDDGFREVLRKVDSRSKPLVLDLMTSGVNLVSLSDMATCLAVGYQRPGCMTVQELAERDVTYIHTDLTELTAWQDIDGWLEEQKSSCGSFQFSLAMTRPEGAFYSHFWHFDNFCSLMLSPTLERLAPGGFLFFQTPFRAYIPEGKDRMRLNTTFLTEGMEKLGTMVLGLKGCGFEACLMPADLHIKSRPFFDLLLMIRNTA